MNSFKNKQNYQNPIFLKISMVNYLSGNTCLNKMKINLWCQKYVLKIVIWCLIASHNLTLNMTIQTIHKSIIYHETSCYQCQAHLLWERLCTQTRCISCLLCSVHISIWHIYDNPLVMPLCFLPHALAFIIYTFITNWQIIACLCKHKKRSQTESKLADVSHLAPSEICHQEPRCKRARKKKGVMEIKVNSNYWLSIY